MSTVKVELRIRNNGFTGVFVDGKSCGSVEDPERELIGVIRKLIENLQIDNTEVVILKEK